MAVRRIQHNIAAKNVEAARSFYQDILEMDPVMDLGWIVTYAGSSQTRTDQTSTDQTRPQLSIASQGGSDTEVPDLSIEVDNFEEVHRRLLSAGIAIAYGPVDEPWGVRRLYVKDPFGTLVNILAHR
ncbi:MAG: VOC family protein [Kiloniellales bacterium]